MTTIWWTYFLQVAISAAPAGWGATFIRLTVYRDPKYAVDLTTYAQQLASIAQVATDQGIVVLLSLQYDASIISAPAGQVVGAPTAGTTTFWQAVVPAFSKNGMVMFGMVNEPESFSTGDNSKVVQAMATLLSAIRSAEKSSGSVQHVVVAQGCMNYARSAACYLTQPLSDPAVAYEVHVYQSNTDQLGSWNDLVFTPAKTLPLIVGETGPVDSPDLGAVMSISDVCQFMSQAQSNKIPVAAWSFNNNCGPNLLAETADVCGIGMQLQPATDSYVYEGASSWGVSLKSLLAGSSCPAASG